MAKISNADLQELNRLNGIATEGEYSSTRAAKMAFAFKEQEVRKKRHIKDDEVINLETGEIEKKNE